MMQMNGTAQIVEAVRRDKTAIRYVSVGYIINHTGQLVEGIKDVGIFYEINGKIQYPSDIESIKSGNYPLSRPLYQFIKSKPEQHILDFIKFELSPEGQEIVEKNGFFRIDSIQR